MAINRNSNHFHPNRRDFLRTVGSGALAGTSLPILRAGGSANASPLPQVGNGIVLPNKTYRSFEWEDQYPPTAKLDVNWSAAMEATRDTGTQCVMVYAKCEWGWAYYPTKVGFQHPHLEGDLFGTEVELAHKNGLSTIGYYALGWDNEAGLKHPDWIWRDEQGRQEHRWHYSWYVPCLDSPYRQYVLGMLEEIFTNYPIDELWLDDYGVKFGEFYGSGNSRLCCCGYTEEAWNRRRGIPYDLLVWPRHLEHVLTVRERRPELRMVVDHLANPPIAQATLEGWGRELESIARLPNIFCKLSGMVTQADWERWTPEDLRPYVAHAVQAFGYDRLMFGSDWPVCTQAGSYQRMVDALREVLHGVTGKDASRVWGGTAAEFYRPGVAS